MIKKQKPIQILTAQKEKLNETYQELVIEGEISNLAPVSVENRKSVQEIEEAIRMLESYEDLKSVRKELIEIGLAFAVVTAIVCTVIIFLAFFLAQKFYENNLNFEFI
jgi:cytochrome c biogenesis protein CcdA